MNNCKGQEIMCQPEFEQTLTGAIVTRRSQTDNEMAGSLADQPW